jgi:hypothetical protein
MIVETADVNEDFLSSRSDCIRDEEWRSRKGLKETIKLDAGFATSVAQWIKEPSKAKLSRLAMNRRPTL